MLFQKAYRFPWTYAMAIIGLSALLQSCGRSQDESTLFGETFEPQIVNRNFSFNLLTSDVGPWATGEMSGKVKPMKRDHATFLEKTIDKFHGDVSLGLYGVQDQPWFLKALKSEDREIDLVVDQERGALNEWKKENFSYTGTAYFAKRIGHAVPDLNATGTPRSSTIMHNKFIVFHNKGVWTGSANLSATCLGAEYNANLSVYIPAPELAKIYQTEFDQMYKQKHFSIYKRSAAKRSLEFKDQTKVQSFFSPQDDPVTQAVLPFIKSANKSIDVGMFVLSHPDVVSALSDASERGVKVRLILDALSASQSREMIATLESAGVVVRVENWGGKMHMKSAVADGTRTLLGSMNWTRAGSTENDENTLVIENKALAKATTTYFSKLWKLLANNGDRTPQAESLASKNSCFDGLDNDYDGLIDDEEPACQQEMH